jgi:AcrR family transcriptional regulator
MRTYTRATAVHRIRTPSAAVRRQLIEAAEAVLVRDGSGALTVRAVACEAAVAPMGVYNRFGGKDGLVDALLIRGFDRLRAVVESCDDADAGERLHSSGLRYREFALANRNFYALMFESAGSRGLGRPEVREHTGAAFGALVQLVELAAATGEIFAPCPALVAQQIWSSAHGAVALELRGLALTSDPVGTYQALLDVIRRGIALKPR